MSWDISWNRKLFINIIQWCYEIVTLHTACERWVLKKYLHFSVVKWVLLIGRPLWKPLPPFIPASMKHLSTCSYDKEYMILTFTCISQYSLIVRTGTFLCLAQALYIIPANKGNDLGHLPCSKCWEGSNYQGLQTQTRFLQYRENPSTNWS